MTNEEFMIIHFAEVFAHAGARKRMCGCLLQAPRVKLNQSVLARLVGRQDQSN